jgi:anti-anti-sigma regulatory factor
VVLAGQLGAEGAAQLDAYLREIGPESNVILDLWDVPQCDSAGVTAIGEAKKYVEEAGWGFAVVGDPKGLCTAALEAAGQVPIFATRGAARAALMRATS